MHMRLLKTIRPLLLPILLLIAHAADARSTEADKINGIWLSEGGEVQLKFEIFRSNDKYYGKLLYASTMYEADGTTPKKDFKNPDAKLRTRSRLKIQNLNGLQYVDGSYTDGTLYNPDDGRTYSLNAELKSADHLEFRGYIGFSLFGKTMTFKRVK